MFQFTWFDKRAYEKCAIKITDKKKVPDNYISLDRIERVRTLYWDEHCLECSPPHCYGNCNFWQRRKDGSCVRFYYGIKRNSQIDGNCLWGAELKFRPWGKLEARINSGAVSVDEIRRLDEWDKRYTSFNQLLSSISSLVFKDRKFSCRAEGIKRRKYFLCKPSGTVEDTFLFQCYAKDEANCDLCLEITDKTNTVKFRKKMSISHGFNQYIYKIDVPLEDRGLIRIYPEKDFEADLVILACDIVAIKPNIPKHPAKKVKCVAWDLDKTIWNDILIESDPDKLELREGVLRTIRSLDERGIIQIVVSKNNDSEAAPHLKRLGIDKYFVYTFINWNAKSANILAAADLLNINVDTFALIDDSFFERNEVSTTLPCVRVYDENSIEALLGREEFNVAITAESKNRREMYQTEAVRRSVSVNYYGDNVAFLRSCELKLSIREPKTKEELERSFDLIHRTNQLNLSGKKYDKADFEALVKSDRRINFIVDCFDKFGSYGQVAFISAVIGKEFVIDEYAMSCRVANKYVESALVQWMIKKYNRDIVLDGNITQRNMLLVDTFEKIGFENHSHRERIKLTIAKETKCLHFDIVEVLK